MPVGLQMTTISLELLPIDASAQAYSIFEGLNIEQYCTRLGRVAGLTILRTDLFSGLTSLYELLGESSLAQEPLAIGQNR